MERRPRLSRVLAESLALGRDAALEVDAGVAVTFPERVLQFGTGGFLRGFAEYFIDEANRTGRFNGSIVAVSSTGSERNAVLNEQEGLFTLVIQGVDQGRAVQRYRIVGSLSRALSARDQWEAVLDVARSASVEIIISNTTEVGIALDESDRFDDAPPASFPGKLTRFLFEHARAVDYDSARGVVVLPCELVENNGAKLRGIVRQLADRWNLDHRFIQWVDEAVVFANTLVDRIVPGAPTADDTARIESLFGYRDGLMTVCETYALFAIEGDDALRKRLGFPGDDRRIVVARDISPYRERKVRVLNGAHTILVPAALLSGLETVSEAVGHEQLGRFLRRAMFDEIVPGIEAPDASAFAHDVLERFANPYIRHALIDITLHQTTKMRVRVVPSIVSFASRKGRVPVALAFGFAAYLAYMRGELQAERRAAGLPVPEDLEGERVRVAWQGVNPQVDAAVAGVAARICADASLWGTDLSSIPGFASAVADHLIRILQQGAPAALETHHTEPATT